MVVTGLGMISPIGNDVDSSWSAALEGSSGVGLNEYFDTEDYAVKICAAVKDFDMADFISPKEARRMDGCIQFGIAAGIQAIEDAKIADYDPSRVGIAVGSGIGGIKMIQETHSVLLNSGPRKVSPFFIPGSVANMMSGNLSIKYGFKGPNIAIVTACTTGTHNIGFGARMIQQGDADVMVVGGAEHATSPITVAGFQNMKALSLRNDEPEKASRPWDKERDGFVIGDGAGVLVLEEYESARNRGAKIYAELIGFGMSSDAFHITGPSEDGEGAVASMKNALRDADLAASEVDYLNAHGTSTPLGDVAETMAIKEVFGQDPDLLVSSTKSMVGHLLGAAGSVEAIFCIKAINDQMAPPTINLDDADEGCDLDYVPHNARAAKIDVAATNSFGFGGTNGTLIFRAA